jgi:hypothetical protein
MKKETMEEMDVRMKEKEGKERKKKWQRSQRRRLKGIKE